MAKAYSDDLRRKLLEAHQQGEESLEELAERLLRQRGLGEKDLGAVWEYGADGASTVGPAWPAQ